MDKSEIRVFIVEDDVTLGKVLSEAIKKQGYQAVLCNNPSEAENQFRIQGAHFFILDCLLPKISGIDLAVKLRSEGAAEVPMVLISGIFKDKTFMKDALQKTGALRFFPKPFNIEEILSLVHSSVEKFVDKEVSPLEGLLVHSLTPAEKIKTIRKLGSIDAFDIPWLCCLLMNPATSGQLSFQNEKEKSAISFSLGKIVRVEMEIPESYFGALLIEGGYLTPEQLEEALKVQSQKRVGEKLVDLNLLSPHVIDLINAEQMAIRLSRIITDTSYQVTFVAEEIPLTASNIDNESLAPFLVDWINSKIQINWLKQRYLQWLNCPTIKVKSNQQNRRIWNLPPLKNVPAMISQFDKGLSLGQVLAQGQYKEEIIYQVFHLLILIDYLRLKKEVRAVDESIQSARLQKLWADMQTQDFFATLGVSKKAKAVDIKKTYHELAKIFHPDRLSPNASSELKNLAQKVFGQMTKAYEVLSDDTKRATHVKEIEMGRAEKILQAESLLEDGKALLKSGQGTKAQELFEKAAALKPPTSELLVHLAWAKMLVMSGQAPNEEELLEAEKILNKIPPEDRHNSAYYFVKGLFQTIIGDTGAAKKNITHALSLNPKFIEAERALRFLDLKKEPKQADLFTGDLSVVVGNFFKKK